MKRVIKLYQFLIVLTFQNIQINKILQKDVFGNLLFFRISSNLQYKTHQQIMKKGVVERLTSTSSAHLIQSTVGQNLNEYSIIQGLNLADQQSETVFTNISMKSITNRDIHKLTESKIASHSPRSTFSFNRDGQIEAEKNIQKLINSRVKNKVEQLERKKPSYFKESGKNKLDYEYRHRKPVITTNDHLLLFDDSKQTDQTEVKMKIDFRRSGILKNKEFIKENLIPQCQFCSNKMMEMSKNGLFCRNSKCRSKRIFGEFQVYPILGILFDMEIPSCTIDDLNELYKKVLEQFHKVEKSRNLLIQLQNLIEKLKQLKQSSMNSDKFATKQFVNYIEDYKQSRGSFDVLEALKSTLTNLNLDHHYQQFKIWEIIPQDDLKQFKNIAESVQKYKPFSLKQLRIPLAQQMATVNNNFENLRVSLHVSARLSFSFTNRIRKLILKIDGTFQLNRDCFLLVEQIEQLHVQFYNKKTSRQLRELFHILPKFKSLYFTFDYKMHSHVSSEQFPLLSKLFELECEELNVEIINARLETLQDLNSACRILTPKTKLILKLQMNQYLIEQQINEQLLKMEKGSNIIISLLKNCGEDLIALSLQLPIKAEKQDITEFILNNEYQKLTFCSMKICEVSRNVQLQNLMQTIMKKKILALGLLTLCKRNHSLHLNQKFLRQATFEMLL